MTATTQRPFAPAVSWPRQEAMALAETARRRLAALLGDLDAADWDRPTDCEGWTMRDLAGHLVGAKRSAASVREQAGGRFAGGGTEDGVAAIELDAVEFCRTISGRSTGTGLLTTEVPI